MFFVERLESMLATGRKLPLTNNVVIDQAGALELVDELRRAIPDEVQDARRINAEGERILERAQEEAERIVARAQEQAAYLIGEEGLTEAAEAEGRRIVGEARAESDAVRQGADEYAASVLTELEGDIVRTLQSIRSGLALLDSRVAGPEQGPSDTDPGAAADREWDRDAAGAPSR
jgi:cell division septum initiation protein DivIVA